MKLNPELWLLAGCLKNRELENPLPSPRCSEPNVERSKIPVGRDQNEFGVEFAFSQNLRTAETMRRSGETNPKSEVFFFDEDLERIGVMTLLYSRDSVSGLHCARSLVSVEGVIGVWVRREPCQIEF